MSEVKIAFRKTGQGPTIILLHGYAGSVLHWDSVVEILQENFTVVVPNLTHLYMAKRPRTFSEQIDLFAQFVIEHFSDQQVHIAGTSYGGAIAWGLAQRYPRLVDRVALINPLPPNPVRQFAIPILHRILQLNLGPRPTFWILSTPIGKIFLQKAAEVFRIERAELWHRLMHLNGRKLLFISHIISNFAFILNSEDWKKWTSELGKWNHPTILFYDQQDPLFKPETYQNFNKLIGNQVIQELHLAGHIATHTRGPEIAEGASSFFAMERVKRSG